MRAKQKKYVEVVKNGGQFSVVFIPQRVELARFVTSDNASASKDAELIEGICNLYENYIRDVFGLQ